MAQGLAKFAVRASGFARWRTRLALPLLAATGLAAGGDASGPPAEDLSLPVVQVAQPPMVDGHGLDEAWRAVAWTTLPDPRLAPEDRLAVKACTDGSRLFLLVRFPAVVERRRHRPWRWDATTQHYHSGGEAEEALTVLLLGANGMVDAWVWRADRTDAAGFADDGSFSPARGFSPDAGTACWESRYVSGFAGAELPRFYPREPTGSLADVRARGVWENGVWTVEMSRLLNTRRPDDLALLAGEAMPAQLFTGLPLEAPMYGRPRVRLELPAPPAGRPPVGKGP